MDSILNPPLSLNWPSIEILESRILGLRRRNFHPAIPNNFYPSFWPNKKCIDIVLLGNFDQALIGSRSWPQRDYRIWVLSQRFRNLVADLFCLDPKKIGILRREILFPELLKVRPRQRTMRLADLKDLDFVYAGHLGVQKNPLLLSYFLKEVASELGNEPRLNICGVSSDKVLQKRMLRIYHKTVFHGDLGFNWAKKFKRHVYLQLSKSAQDDFGVSATQALIHGLPAILPAWAGHLEFAKWNCNLIPHRYLQPAESAAREIVANFDSFNNKHHEPGVESRPLVITPDELRSCVSSYCKKRVPVLGPNLDFQSRFGRYVERYLSVLN